MYMSCRDMAYTNLLMNDHFFYCVNIVFTLTYEAYLDDNSFHLVPFQVKETAGNVDEAVRELPDANSVNPKF